RPHRRRAIAPGRALRRERGPLRQSGSVSSEFAPSPQAVRPPVRRENGCPRRLNSSPAQVFHGARRNGGIAPSAASHALAAEQPTPVTLVRAARAQVFGFAIERR